MDDFIVWLFGSFYDFLNTLSINTASTISNIFNDYSIETVLNIDFNLTLFSDTPIFTMSIYETLILFFSIFYTVIFIVIVWKIIKRLFNRLFRWGY